MAEKTQENAKERVARTENYAQQVRREYAQAVDGILALKKSVPTLPAGQMYSFDGDSKKVQRAVEQTLRQLHAATLATIKTGCAAEWQQANDEVDALLATTLGKKAASNPALAAWYDRNEKAMDAFLARSNNGLNLSERIWKNTQQFRDEMEVAMTVAIGEGESASAMSRRVRQYLNDPDLMFRRFRYKDDDGNWQRKWKKRVKTADGRYKFVDYDRNDYKVGAGMYKSSYRNAMRLTRTETNMAYRRADHDRWQNLDFVRGQHIETSRTHDERGKEAKDICDQLAGDYPREFVFDGWHPQCMCICTAIMRSPEEMRAKMAATLKGETYEYKEKPITTYPKGFRKFIEDNRERIAAAEQRGTQPYFIKYNADAVNGILKKEVVEDATAEDASIVSTLPVTLQHLDEAIQAYQYTSPELKAREEEVITKMKELFANNDFGMEVHLKDLELIFKNGFKNTFEVGKSGGYLGSTKTSGMIEQDHHRLVASHRMFSDAGNYISYDPLSQPTKSKLRYTGQQYARSQYEKYGYLLDNNKSRSYKNRPINYGDVEVRFKKDKVQCTWTFNDSLVASEPYPYYQPSLTSDPKVESLDQYNIPYYYAYEGNSDKITNWLSSKDWGNLTKFTKRAGTNYIELQYHGDLTFDSVESLVFGDNPEKLLSQDFIKQLQNSGVALWYSDNGKVKKYKY